VLNTGATFDNPDRVIPYTDQVSLGVERQLRSDFSISADYVHAFARDQLMAVALNPTLRATTSVTSPNVRQGSDTLRQINAALLQQYPTSFRPFTGAVTTYDNVGETDYDALMMSVEKRYSNNWMARVSYTLSHSRGNTSASGIPASPVQVLDDLNLDLNEGPTNFDQRHNFVVSGMAIVPRTGGLSVSWVARALSGQPFTIFDSTIDEDRNGTVSDPLPAGSYSGAGENAISVDNAGGRNGAYGPGFFKLDLRLGYSIGLAADRRIELFGEIFNVTESGEFRGSQWGPGLGQLPAADGPVDQHERAATAIGCPLPVLNQHSALGSGLRPLRGASWPEAGRARRGQGAVFPRNAPMRSIGNGKTIVEFCSAAISLSVCR
jgi:hypothetical protein